METNLKEDKEFQSKDFIHLFIQSSIGVLPIKVGILSVIEENEGSDSPDDGVKIEIEFAVDEEYSSCPDISTLPSEEAIGLIEHLRVEVPKKVEEILVEAAKSTIEENENND